MSGRSRNKHFWVFILDALAQAKVDTNKDKITYGRPDLQLLRNFCNLKFGWAYAKTDEIMEPVIKASLCLS